MFGLFGNKSRLLCIAVHDGKVKVAVVNAKKNVDDDIKMSEEEPFKEGSVKLGAIQNMEEVTGALKRALERMKKVPVSKMPVVMSVPATLSFSAFIDDQKAAAKGKGNIRDLVEQWLPFRAEELTIQQHSIPATPLHPAYTYVSAIELKTLQSYRTLCRQAGIGSPECIPKTHALSRLAFGEKGPDRYSLILDLTTSPPVVSLCINNAVVDERVLFGADPSAPFRESLQSWVPKVTAQFSEKQVEAPAKMEEKKDAKKKDEKKDVKNDEKKDAKKEEPAKTESVPAAPAPSVAPAKAQTVIRMVVYGDEAKMFESYASRLKNVSAVVTEVLPLKDLSTAFALGLSAAHISKSPLPRFS